VNPKVSQIRWWLLSLIIAASQPLNCGGSMPDPLQRAQAACTVQTQATIGNGECDGAEDLDHCTPYLLDMIQCRQWLDIAEAQMRQAGAK
jgi:hypothetical protein